MKTTDKKTTYIIISVIAVIIIGSILHIPNTSQENTDLTKTREEIVTNPGANLTDAPEEMVIGISRSYIVTEVEDVNALADIVIQGAIIKKYSALESRDEFGVLVNSNSKDVALSVPFLVYEVQPSQTFKGEKAESVLVKVAGGNIGNLSVRSDDEEWDVGETVVFLLNGPYENGLYQLVAGPYASFSVKDGKAVGKYEEMSLEELQNRLN